MSNAVDDYVARAPADATRRNARRASGAMLIALIILAVLNAAALERIIGNLGSSIIAEELLIKAGEWRGLMDNLGFGRPGDFIREHVAAFRELGGAED